MNGELAMTLTARHKKAGGFRKLVNSLETTAPDKRAKILDSLRVEDPEFVADVEKCIFSFDEFGAIGDMIIAEIISSLSDGEIRSLAFALYKGDEALREKFKKNMTPKQFLVFREADEAILQLKLSEKLGGQFKIVEKARILESQSKFNLKRYNPKYPDF